MRLNQLKKDLRQVRLVHYQDREIKSLTCDSREARDGSLFIAITGETQDGHPYAVDARANGAGAVLVERRLDLPDDIPQIIVDDTREATAILGARFFGHPSERVSVAGVTGTSGKTTTTWMLRSILQAAGRPAGLIGTIHYLVGGRKLPARNTTPSPIEINRMLAEMYEAGQQCAVMEVSSHALVQKRVHGVDFKVAVFTNLTDNEHLDFHKTFIAYRDAKCKLFEPLSSASVAVLNLEDPSSGYIAQRTQAKIITYAVSRDADVRSIVLGTSMSGTQFELFTPQGSAEVKAGFFGRYNVSNATAAAAAALSMGVGIEAIRAGLEQYQGTPGRLEMVDLGQNFSVLVDYAHKPDALANVLTTLREVTSARIILVFGCGGDRDRGKRPRMGAIAAKYSDCFILTADNSRSERTEDIIAEIEMGVGTGANYAVQPDRALAIRAAIGKAQPGDVVLIAGKGHEACQIMDKTTTPFDDCEQARQALRDLMKTKATATVA